MNEYKILLAGNPNVGKSSIFNELTGEKQHTGNWIGKTVETKLGNYIYNNKIINIYDLPGTYSLNSNSKEEEVTRNQILYENYDLIVLVVDSTTLQRNLNLVFQILEYTNKVVLCLNLIDEAKKMNIEIDSIKLNKLLNIDIVKTSAKEKIGLKELKEIIDKNINNNYNKIFKIKYNEEFEDSISIIEEDLKEMNNKRFIAIKLLENNLDIINKFKNKGTKINQNIIKKANNIKKELEQNKPIIEYIGESYYKMEKNITEAVVKKGFDKTTKFRNKLDNILTNKITGIPIMLILIMLVFYITIEFANIPSSLLFDFFLYLEDKIIIIFDFLHVPDFIKLPLINGVYKTLTWVISVMLPPMAIFFPMFSLLEDLGYLPRVVFNLDGIFQKVNSCGKQSLTMMMGFGCNAVGVTNARIIENKNQRLIAILTNSFVPCNGRFPTIIALITMFLASSKILSVTYLFLFILFSFITTLIISYMLSKTILKNQNSSFILELPPYRKPNVLKTLIRSFKDKTLKILYRAIIVSIPAGLIIYILANTYINNLSILNHITNFLNPFALLMGLNGIILTAFILGMPANEIVFPIIIMILLNTGIMIEIDDMNILKNLLITNGWNTKIAFLTIIFSIFHFPCSTTLLTIYKETKNIFWTFISFVLPTIVGIILCMFLNFIL